ncbi:ABC transporter permease [Xylophilus sp. ASV27]|uniref:ABC transporter permease n=1 Tax=Xylophilus sp. ASV27 TaxID=2795129 RepID=UPI0018EE3628|nr:ABC transporter permease [Xylophilus sp. ASV27]
MTFTTPNPWLGRLSPRNISAVYLLIFMVLFALAVIPDKFLHASTLPSIIDNVTMTALLAVALTLPLATGQYDLSVGTLVAFTGVVTAVIQTRLGLPIGLAIPLSIVAGVLTGAIVGAANAFLVVKLRIFSLIATLGMNSILIGLTAWVSNNRTIAGLDDGFKALVNTPVVGSITLGPVYLLLISIVLWFVLEHTPVGRYLYATGGNPDAARLAGVPTARYVTLALVLCGAIAAFAGIALAARAGGASGSGGPGFLLPAFAAAFLGATQFKGGRFNVWGTVLAVFTLETGSKILYLWLQQAWLTNIFYGFVLIVAVGVASSGALRRGKKKAGPAAGASTLRSGDGAEPSTPAPETATAAPPRAA